MTVVAVVIPFFQRETGILARALTSVFAQKLPSDTRLTVVIVDDQSPVPARDELLAISTPEEIEILVVEQDNGGPGAARNAALDQLDSENIDFVAFLDSDDEWQPDHLDLALRALGDDLDFFFSDHRRFDSPRSWFEDSEAAREWKTDPLSHLEPISAEDQLYRLPNAVLFDLSVDEYLSQTSTVVYRFASHPALRFDTEQRNAGEDLLFWLSLMASNRKTAISTRENVYCGRGVNIYYSTFDWSDKVACDRYGYLVLLYLKIKERFELAVPQRRRVDRLLKRYMRAYGYLVIRFALKGQLPSGGLLRTLFVRAPEMALLLPYYFVSVLPRRKAEAKTWN